MNPNPFKHVCYVHLLATMHVCLVDGSVNNVIPTDRDMQNAFQNFFATSSRLRTS